MIKIFKNLSVGKRIGLGFLSVVAIVVGLGAISLHHLTSIQTRTKTLLEDAMPGAQLTQAVQVKNIERQFLVYRFATATTPEQRTALEAEFLKVRGEINAIFESYEKAVSDAGEQALAAK